MTDGSSTVPVKAKTMTITEEDWKLLIDTDGHVGWEFDWFALDRAGFLGLFSTAGEGPVPRSVWKHRVEYCELTEASENLPGVFLIEKVFNGSGNYGDWWECAARGIYAFDFQDIHRIQNQRSHAYELIAQPKDPVSAKVLIDKVDLSWLPRLNLEFHTSHVVPVGEIV